MCLRFYGSRFSLRPRAHSISMRRTLRAHLSLPETFLLGPSRRLPSRLTLLPASHMKHDSIKMEYDDRTDSELAHDHGEEVVG